MLGIAALQVALSLVARFDPDRALWALPWWVWLIPAGLEAVLAVAIGVGQRGGIAPTRIRRTVLTLIGLLALANGIAVAALVLEILRSEPGGQELLLMAFTIWMSTVAMFGLAFWELERGAPGGADEGGEPLHFLFPQQTDPRLGPWEARLVDYVYVAFTNSIAFSPTDTMPLSRTAKGLMAAESMLSLVVILLVVSRGVGILTGSNA